MPRERVPVAVCVCKTFCGPTRNDCSSKQREANDIPVDDVGIFQSSFDGGMEGGVRLSRWHGDGGGSGSWMVNLSAMMMILLLYSFPFCCTHTHVRDNFEQRW